MLIINRLFRWSMLYLYCGVLCRQQLEWWLLYDGFGTIFKSENSRSRREYIWHITFWVKGERGGKFIHVCCQMHGFYFRRIAMKLGTGCPSERGTGNWIKGDKFLLYLLLYLCIMYVSLLYITHTYMYTHT